MIYRPEIDGLRAIAIVSVLLYHAGFTMFSGGYIGVDIFFVISGFLITSIILNEIDKGTFSIIAFYERRARRILPALFFMILCIIPLSLFFMIGEEQKDFGKSLIYVSLFISNILFAKQTDYFATNSDTIPLLHTWSLAIEEQYYLFFPLLLLLIWQINKSKIFFTIISIGIVSLFICQLGGNFTKQYPFVNSLELFNSPSSAFYMIFTRAWELMIGSAIAYLMFIKRFSSSNTLSISGLVMILLSILLFNKNTPFPSIYTLFPTIGTALIILYSSNNTYVTKILSIKFITAIGLISYSTYLWHQPIFAFFRLSNFGQTSTIEYIFLIVLTFLLAFFSWRYIEKPFRDKTFLSTKLIFQQAFTFTVLIISIGFLNTTYSKYNLLASEDASVISLTIQPSPMREKCHTSGEDYLAPNKACRYFYDNTTWAILGDSHGVEPAYALSEKLKDKKEGVLHLSFSGCPPSILNESKTKGCRSWTSEALNYINSSQGIKNVVLTYRHSVYLFGENSNSFPILPEEPSEMYGASNNNEARKIYLENFTAILESLLKHNKKVYVLYPIPEIGKDIKTYLKFLNKHSPSISVEYYNQRNNFIISYLDSLEWNKNLIKIKPSDTLCNQDRCFGILNNTAMYFDTNHLTVEGSRKIMNNVS